MGLAPAISRSQGKRPDHKATLPNQGRHMAYMLRQVNEEFLFVISFGESVPSRDFAGCDETKNACERNETLGTKLNLKLTSAILEFLGCESDGKCPMLFYKEELIKKKKKQHQCELFVLQRMSTLWQYNGYVSFVCTWNIRKQKTVTRLPVFVVLHLQPFQGT